MWPSLFLRNFLFFIISKDLNIKTDYFFSEQRWIALIKIFAFCTLQLIKFEMRFHVFASFSNRNPEIRNKFVSFLLIEITAPQSNRNDYDGNTFWYDESPFWISYFSLLPIFLQFNAKFPALQTFVKYQKKYYVKIGAQTPNPCIKEARDGIINPTISTNPGMIDYYLLWFRSKFKKNKIHSEKKELNAKCKRDKSWPDK